MIVWVYDCVGDCVGVWVIVCACVSVCVCGCVGLWVCGCEGVWGVGVRVCGLWVCGCVLVCLVCVVGMVEVDGWSRVGGREFAIVSRNMGGS